MNRKNRRIYDYLELMRIPGVFTAQADIIAGFLIAGGGFQQSGRLFILLFSTSFIYSAGMILNDYYDYEVDDIERPGRPLPSGRIPIKAARYTGYMFIAAGLTFAFFAGISSFLTGMALSFFVVAYNIRHKKNPAWGSFLMGGCRYLNLLLGLSVTAFQTNSLFIPLLTGCFTSAICIISKRETDGGDMLFSVCLAAFLISVIFFLYYTLNHAGILPNASGLILCFIFSVYTIQNVLKLIKHTLPDEIQSTVKKMILSIVILDGIIVAGVHPLYVSLIVWMMLIPSVYVSKKFYVT